MNFIEEVLAESLDIDIPLPRAQGRKAPMRASVVRDLNVRDLAVLAAGAGKGTTVSILQIKHSHHTIARLLAEGKSNVEISAITGMTPGRISALKGAPAMQELIAHYSKQVEEVFVDFHQRLADMSINVLETLMERLEAQPEKFSIQELRELLKLGSDRTGFGPTSKVQHSAHLGEDVLRAIKEEAGRRGRSTVKTIDISPSAPDDSGTGVGRAVG